MSTRLTWRESNYQIADFPIYTTTLDNGGGYVVSPGFFHPALLFSGFVVSHYQRGCNPAEVARRAAMLEYSRDATELKRRVTTLAKAKAFATQHARRRGYLI